MSQLPPKLGPFELLRRIGAGGMAETFLAVRRGPGGFEQRVCIKRILPAYESDQEFVASFLDEARTSAALRHANIVQVVDFGTLEEDGSHYLALELVDGLDLRGVTQRAGVLDWELVTLVAAELASALAYAHTEDEDRAPVVHRDLSPSNVMVSRNGEIKLGDFGIARVIGGAHRTASGVIKGKVPYMPPEYVDGGRFDARGDLFSLGVMLFELCHGERPYDGNSELDTMRRIASGERRAFTASAPPAFVACVERLLHKAPEDRFPDALALLDALPPIAVHQTRKRLATLVRGPGTQTERPAPDLVFQPTLQLPQTPPKAGRPSTPPHELLQTSTRTAPRSASPSRGALVALAGALGVALAVGGVWFMRRARPSPVTAAPTPAAEPVATDPPSPPVAVEDDPEDEEPSSPLAPSAHEPVILHEPEKDAPAPTRKPHHATHEASPSAAKTTAELRVVVYPYGDVWVDDKLAGASPLTLKLAPGTHEIGAGEGRQKERRTVHLRAGDTESVTFR